MNSLRRKKIFTKYESFLWTTPNQLVKTTHPAEKQEFSGVAYMRTQGKF